MNDIEKLRCSFRPKHITTLFVGESPPHGGTFFYKRDSLLYHRMKEAFSAGENFLTEFKANCFFLEDLVQYPINQIKNRKKRQEHRRKSVPLLAGRIKDYQPTAVVALMCGIETMVRDAMREASLPSEIQLYVTPFPGRPEHLVRFKAKMAEIIPQLPTGNCID